MSSSKTDKKRKRVRKRKNLSKNAKIIKKKENEGLLYRNFDYTILLVVITLVLFGTVMVFSASYYHFSSRGQDMFTLLKRQALYAVMGLSGMFFMMFFSYDKLKRLSFLIYIISNILLIVVLFAGEEAKGSVRWLYIGSFGFQPSELAKPAIILFLSTVLSNKKDLLKNFKGFIVCCIIVGIPAILIAVQNLSTAIVVVAIGFAIMFIASPKIWYFVLVSLPVALAGALLLLIPKYRYRLERIEAWLDPFADPTGKGFQTVQSLYAIGSGGLFGLGLGQSRQKLDFIPEAYNDIIFSIIAEELGFFGAASLLILYIILIYRGVRIALNAKDLFGSYVAFGIVAFIAVQVIINIAVVTNTIPVTGMALPFVSYGGTALIVTLGCMGILLNISSKSKA